MYVYIYILGLYSAIHLWQLMILEFNWTIGTQPKNSTIKQKPSYVQITFFQNSCKMCNDSKVAHPVDLINYLSDLKQTVEKIQYYINYVYGNII